MSSIDIYGSFALLITLFGSSTTSWLVYLRTLLYPPRRIYRPTY